MPEDSDIPPDMIATPASSDVEAPPANISVRPGTEVPIAYGVYQIGEV